MELITLVYKGNTNKYCVMPNYSGIVEPGKDYQTTQQAWDNELKNNPNWVLKKNLKEKPEIKKDKKESVKNG